MPTNQITPDQLVYEIGLLYVKLTIAERRIAQQDAQLNQKPEPAPAPDGVTPSQPNPNSMP